MSYVGKIYVNGKKFPKIQMSFCLHASVVALGKLKGKNKKKLDFF